MKALFERNYKAVVKRGLINGFTTDYGFLSKLKEEALEAESEIDFKEPIVNTPLDLEIADCLIVCSNWLIHRGVDLKDILTKIAEKNENRND
jgi:phosphoribosyl-ATP pyrophosphohydrolase